MSKETSSKVKQVAYLDDFKCAADKCVDTCCSQWIINITTENKKYYDKNNLEIAKNVEPHSDGAFRMKERDNGDCIQLKNGLCSLQQKHGETNLPDVCYTFPRTYKQIENSTYMAANLACPESLKVALYNNKKTDFSSWSEITQSRDKTGLYDGRSGGLEDLDEDEVVNIFNSITKMIDDPEYSAEESLARVLLLSQKMDEDEDFDWDNIDSEINNITKNKILKISYNNEDEVDMREEIFSVLDAMFDLINRDRPRYNMVVAMVKKHLGDQDSDEDELIENWEVIYENWEKSKKEFNQILKNLLKAQLSYIIFPVNNYFSNQYNSIAVIALEFLVIKIALMVRRSQSKRKLTIAQVIDVVQPTAKRFFVRGNQELYDFCKDANWDDYRTLITVVLNLTE